MREDRGLGYLVGYSAGVGGGVKVMVRIEAGVQGEELGRRGHWCRALVLVPWSSSMSLVGMPKKIGVGVALRTQLYGSEEEMAGQEGQVEGERGDEVMG